MGRGERDAHVPGDNVEQGNSIWQYAIEYFIGLAGGILIPIIAIPIKCIEVHAKGNKPTISPSTYYNQVLSLPRRKKRPYKDIESDYHTHVNSRPIAHTYKYMGDIPIATVLRRKEKYRGPSNVVNIVITPTAPYPH